jgi:hypothetical protein
VDDRSKGLRLVWALEKPLGVAVDQRTPESTPSISQPAFPPVGSDASQAP